MTIDKDVPGISPKQTAFLLLDEREALFGGAAGGGKSEALLIGALQNVDDYPKSSLLLRKTFRDLDKPQALMFRARQWLAGTDAHWDGINHRWNFPSGATLQFGFIDHDGDELKFQSSEYHFVGFDELTHFPEHHYLYMFSRMRRLKDTPVGLQMRGGTNPGGPGHEWVRKRFDLPNGPRHDPKMIFINATLWDNPFLEAEEYAEGLDLLGDLTKAQLLYGDWTATSTGGYFKAENFKVIGWDEVPTGSDFVAIIRYWDFAATEPSDLNPDPDYTVGLKLGLVENPPGSDSPRDWYVLDVERFRGNPGMVENRLKAVAANDGPRVVQWLEQERGAAGKLLFQNYATNVIPKSTARPLWAQGTKEVKAAVAAARVDEGRVYLADGPWVDDFMSECAAFPLGSHDDQVDGISNAIIAIDKERVFASQGQVQKLSEQMRPVSRGRRRRREAHIGY